MSWFDSLINTVREAISGVGSYLSQQINNGIAGVYGALNYVTNGVIGNIYNASNAVGNTINGVYYGLSNGIDNAQRTVQNTVNSAANAVLTRINDTTSAVYNTANNVVNAITNNVSGGLSNVLNTVWSATNTLQNGISSAQQNIGNALAGATNTIASQIGGALSQVGNLVGSLTQSLSQNIDAGLSGLASGIGQLGAGILGGIDSGLSQIGQIVGAAQETVSATLQNLSPDLGAIASAITTGKPLADALAAAAALVAEGLRNATGNLDLVSQNKASTYADILNGKYTTPEEIINALFDPPPDEGFATRFIELAGAVVGTIGLFSAVGGVLARPWIQAINNRNQTELLSPDALATGVVQNQVSLEQATEIAALSGLQKSYFETLVNIAGMPPGMSEMLEMWRRGFMTEVQVDQGLRESRLKNKYNEQVKKLRYILPTLQDVIRMAVRDAWRDDVASQYGYDDDFPGKVAELAPQLGIDPDWIRRYWRAHWELPSVQQVFEMLHRQKETGVDAGTVETFLRVADVPKYWRDKLMKISYNPFTRVDVRRMFKVGTLTRDGVLQAYRDIGYDETRAQALTDFTVKLEDSQGQLDPDALERKVYTALENLFVRGKRSEGDLRTAMQKFGWGEEAITYQLQIAKLRQEAFNKVDSKDASGLTDTLVQRQIVERQIDLYIRNQGSLGEAEASMREYGWGDDIITLMLKRATLDKLLDASPTQRAQLKQLSISAILEAYEAHSFSADEVKVRLVALGLSPDDAQTELDIKDYQIATSIRNKIVSAIQKGFLQNRIAEAEVTAALLKFGFTVDESNNYIALWTLDKSLQHKDFTEAQLATFLKHGVVTPEQYQSALADLGWSTGQIAWWSALRGVDVTITG